MIGRNFRPLPPRSRWTSPAFGRGVFWCLLLGCLLLADGVGHAQTPGSVDTGFRPGSGINDLVYAVAPQADGRIVVSGRFVMVNGLSRHYLARLNADGSGDASFAPNVEGWATILAVQADGKVLLGGVSKVDGVDRTRFARLNADGSLDAAFNPVLGFGNSGSSNPAVNGITVQPDGKILLLGNFSTVNGTSHPFFARLNADGSLDTGFNPSNGGGPINSFALQKDGKILIGDSYTNFISYGRVMRLNADGNVDGSFQTYRKDRSTILSIALQTDGKVVLGGSVSGSSSTSTPTGYLARLNANGSVDADFNVGAGANYSVRWVAAQADGKVVISGDFTRVNNTACGYLARLNTDGSVDAAFGAGGGASPFTYTNQTVYGMALQADGKSLFGGNFSAVNGGVQNYLARLNTDGSPDGGFRPGSGVNGFLEAVAPLADGKVLVGGVFSSVGSVAHSGCARLNADGTADLSFLQGSGTDNVPTNLTSVTNLTVQGDGKILLGGYFTTVNGNAHAGIARLLADGNLDTGFNAGISGGSARVRAVALQPDDKAVLVGGFTTADGVARNAIARLNRDGSLDTGFNAGFGATDFLAAVVVQPDGKIVVGGNFTSVGGVACKYLARLNADGSLDGSFAPGDGPDNSVTRMALQADGKIVFIGDFTTVNGATRFHVARLNADGSLDASFDPGSVAPGNVTCLGVQTDGKIVVGGYNTAANSTSTAKLVRLLANGSLDGSFDAGPNAAFADSLALQGDGKLFVIGRFTTVNGVLSPYIVRLNGNLEAVPPGAATGGADTLTTTGATLRAIVNPQRAATTAAFQYGLTTAYGSSTAPQNLGAGTGGTAVSATLGGLTVGTAYHYRIVATNATGTTNGSDRTFTTLSVAEGWRQTYFGTAANAGQAADAADPDGDGVPNLLERALGLDPTAASVGGLPTVARDGSGRLVLTARKGGSSDGMVFRVEASADLLTWTTAGVTVLTDDANTLQARDDGPAGARRFLRLRVTQP